MTDASWLADGASTPVVIVIAILGLTGAIGASLLTKAADRRLHAREILLAPAEEFARNSLTALTALRGITPPPVTDRIAHRNEHLIGSTALVDERLAACHEAMDAVRISRSAIRLVFTPRSFAAAHTQQVLAALRAATETAEQFYGEVGLVTEDARPEWRAGAGKELRREYKAWQSAAYVALDRFYSDVASRLHSPTWNPRRIPSRWTHDEKRDLSVTATVIAPDGRTAEVTASGHDYEGALRRIDDDVRPDGAQISKVEVDVDGRTRHRRNVMYVNPRHPRT